MVKRGLSVLHDQRNSMDEIKPGTRLIHIEIESLEEPDPITGSYSREIEVLLIFIKEVQAINDEEPRLPITAWMCKDVETGQIAPYNPMKSMWYFDGESPLTRKKK